MAANINNQYIETLKKLAEIDSIYVTILQGIEKFFDEGSNEGKKYTIEHPYVPDDIDRYPVLRVENTNLTGQVATDSGLSDAPFRGAGGIPAAVNIINRNTFFAKENPRFNQTPNPLYYYFMHGLVDSVSGSDTAKYDTELYAPYVGQMFSKQSRNSIKETSNDYQDWVSLMNQNIARYNGNIKEETLDASQSDWNTVIPTVTDYAQFFQENDGKNHYYQYDDLHVHVGNNDFQTYWDSVIPSLKTRARVLLNTANNVLDEDLGSNGLFLDTVVKNTVGIDFYRLKKNAIFDLEKKVGLDTDSEDPLFGAIHGLILGQEYGENFTTSIKGFHNSETNRNAKFGDPGWSLRKEINNLTNNSLGKIETGLYEDRASWYLPNTNPALYPLDHRMLFGSSVVPTKHDITTLFGDIQSRYFDSNAISGKGIGDTFVGIGNDILKDLGGAAKTARDFLKDAGNSLLNIGDTLIGGGKNTASNNDTTYFDRFNPDSIPEDGNLQSWDRALKVVLAGGHKDEAISPLIPLQGHSDYVVNTPMAQKGKWYIVDKQLELERNSANYVSNFAIDIANRGDYPNIKAQNIEDMQLFKKDLNDMQILYEGVQQVDGSYESYSYSGYDAVGPSYDKTYTIDATYAANTKASEISNLLGEDGSAYGNTYRTFKDSPAVMAGKEPQYFPFYMRTISRDDFALVQQPFYDNGAVFMGKRKVSGNSVVFFDATVANINEQFQSQILSEQFMGRTEPILLYAGTTRSFSFEFTLPVTRPSDIPSVRAKTNEIIRMMYPQVQTISEVGVVGYRRGPVVELRIGDQWLLRGMIQSTNLTHGLDSGIWNLDPGGRVLRGVRIALSLLVTHAEMPNATTDFYSPTFRPEVFYPSK